jgi:hypothetical protein
LSTGFCFLQQLSAFFNGYLIFLNGYLIFLNGFPLSEKSKKIYLRREVYKRSLFELRIFCHLLSHSRSKLGNTRYNTQQLAEPPKPMGSLLYEYFPHRNDSTHLGRRWVQPDGVVAHVKIKGCSISEAF